jgi:hypothetical protein
MKLKHKLAEDAFWIRHPNGALTVVAEAWPSGFIAGFNIGLKMAADRIKNSVDLSKIKNPSDEFINCSLQSVHDHRICLNLIEEDVPIEEDISNEG